jgi:hypothetical protein
MVSRPAFFSLMALLLSSLVAACSGFERVQDDCGTNGDCVTGFVCLNRTCSPDLLDAGASDGGVVQDGGPGGSPDSGPSTGLDSGMSNAESGNPSDSGSPTDAGSISDAGNDVDAASPTDAGGFPDAGTSIDAGTSMDAGMPADAGPALDAGSPEDSGSPTMDAATNPSDAAIPPMDAGASGFDGGQADDAGASDWWNANWRLRWPLDFTGHATTTLSYFPVLFVLPCGDPQYECADQVDDSTFRFVDEFDNSLPFEVDQWNASGNSLFWIRISTLHTGAQSTRIWLYGDPINQFSGAGAREPRETWGNEFQGVYHMADDGRDSSQGVNDGFDIDVSATGGAVGRGAEFDQGGGTFGCITLPDNTDFLTNANGATLMAWVYVTANNIGSNQDFISISINNGGLSTVTSRHNLFLNTSGRPGANMRVDDSDGPNPRNDPAQLALNEWVHLTSTLAGSGQNLTWTLYVDGALSEQEILSTTNDPISQLPFSNTVATNSALGCEDNGSGRYLRGRMDEVRIINEAKSGAWVNTQYVYQNTPESRVLIGAPETAP